MELNLLELAEIIRVSDVITHQASHHQSSPVITTPQLTAMAKLPSLQDAMANVFEKWAKFVARRPWTVILLSVILAGGLSAGMTVMQSTGQSDQLWSIRTRGYDDDKYMTASSGSDRSAMFVYCERVGTTAGSSTPSIFDEGAFL